MWFTIQQKTLPKSFRQIYLCILIDFVEVEVPLLHSFAHCSPTIEKWQKLFTNIQQYHWLGILNTQLGIFYPLGNFGYILWLCVTWLQNLQSSFWFKVINLGVYFLDGVEFIQSGGFNPFLVIILLQKKTQYSPAPVSRSQSPPLEFWMCVDWILLTNSNHSWNFKIKSIFLHLYIQYSH